MTVDTQNNLKTRVLDFGEWVRRDVAVVVAVGTRSTTIAVNWAAYRHTAPYQIIARVSCSPDRDGHDPASCERLASS